MELVWEFYSNIHAISNDGSFDVSLRNIQFRVTPCMLADLLNVPRMTNFSYPYTRTSVPSKPTIAAFLCGYEINWDGRTPLHTVEFPLSISFLVRSCSLTFTQLPIRVIFALTEPLYFMH
ncbi:hypothetical protein I3842_09G164300 [Carya illinoinensis]|uniref:Uncharacterized protein n=1 Tax=Carya illinoinensis TaxID=32201 RepID=A0A922J711_CARIL|nr:hypothetical protein I3842_09G164300 [Carya illinoinensis]